MTIANLVDFLELASETEANATIAKEVYALNEEDSEAGFLLASLLRYKPTFLKDLSIAKKESNAQLLLQLALDAEQLGIPVTFIVFLYELLDRTNNSTLPPYFSPLSKSFLTDARTQYGKTFGLGTKTSTIENQNGIVSFGNILLIKNDQALESLPYSTKRKAKNVYFGMGVTNLPDDFFSNNQSIETVYLPDTLATLGKGCFENCQQLSRVYGGRTIQHIGEKAFANCAALLSIPSQFEQLETIGPSVFENCVSIQQLSFGKKLVALPSRAFANMTSLVSVAFSSAIESIGASAFYSCTKLQTIDGKIAVTIFPDKCFSQDGNLLDFGFLPKAFKAPNSAFEGTTFVLSEEQSLKEILLEGDCAAYWLKQSASALGLLPVTVNGYVPKLKDILIHFGTKEIKFKTDNAIPDNCFIDCSTLESIDIESQTIQRIGHRAFYNCSRLTKLSCHFSDGLEVADWAFAKCPHLEIESIIGHCESIGSYAFLENETIKVLRVPQSAKYVGMGCFASCPNITILDTHILGQQTHSLAEFFAMDNNDYRFPRSLANVIYRGKEIDAETFARMENITELLLLNVNTIQGKAFQDCKAIQKIVFGSSLTAIDAACFLKVATLISVVFRNNKGKYVADDSAIYAKNETTNELSLVYFFGSSTDISRVLANVTKIEAYAFQNRSLPNLVIPENVKTLAPKALYECAIKDLQLFGIGESLGSFFDCTIDNFFVAGNEIPYGLFEYHLERQPHFESASFQKLAGRSITELFKQSNNSQLNVYLNSLAIKALEYRGQPFINDTKRNIYIHPSKIAVQDTRVYSKGLPYGDYDRVFLDEQSTEIDGLLESLTRINVLEIDKTSQPLSVRNLLGKGPSFLPSLIVHSSIAVKGLSSLSIADLYCDYELETKNVFAWGQTAIERLHLSSRGSLTRKDLLTIQQTITKNVYIAGEALSADDFQVENGVLIAFIGEKKNEISIKPGICQTIRAGAFAGIQRLTSLTIPNGVSLQSNAFPDLVFLEELTIDATCNYPITTLFSYEACRSLKRIILQGQRTKAAFCDGLKGLLKIECKTKEIGSFAFANCVNVRQISLPNDASSIDDFAFHNCKSLEEVSISGSVKYLGFGLFSGCTALKVLRIPTFVGHRLSRAKEGTHTFGSLFGNLISQEDSLYETIEQITEFGPKTYRIPAKLKEIHAIITDQLVSFGFFSGVQKHIILEGPLAYVFGSAFENAGTIFGLDCSDLKRVGTRAFYNSNIDFPPEIGYCDLQGLQKVGEGGMAFANMPFKTIVAGDCSSWTGLSLASLFGPSEKAIENFSCKIFPSVGSLCLSSLKEIKGSFVADVVPESYFSDIKTLRSITIFNPIKEVRSSAFYGLTLNQLALEFKDEASLFNNAFYGVDFTKLHISFEKITYLGKAALSYCEIDNLDFLPHVSFLGQRCFFGTVIKNPVPEIVLCANATVEKDSLHFKKVEIDTLDLSNQPQFDFMASGLKGRGIKIQKLLANAAKGNNAFSGYEGSSLTLLNTPSTIPSRFFGETPNLVTLTLQDSHISSLSRGCFSSLSNIQTINAMFAKKVAAPRGSLPTHSFIWEGQLPETIETDIGEVDESFSAFARAVINLHLSSSLIVGPFATLKALRNVKITGANVQISNNAFIDSGLETIEIPNNLQSVGDCAFKNAYYLKTFTYGKKSRFSVGQEAFFGDSSLSISNSLLNHTTSIGTKAFVGCILPNDIKIPLHSSGVKEAFSFGSAQGIWFVGDHIKISKANKNEILNLVLNGPFEDGFTLEGMNALAKLVVDRQEGPIPPQFCKRLESLTEVEIKDGVTSIGKEAFFGCKKINKVSIPKTVKGIDTDAFCGCSKHLIIELEDEESLAVILQNNKHAFCISHFLFIKQSLSKQNIKFRKKGK